MKKSEAFPFVLVQLAKYSDCRLCTCLDVYHSAPSHMTLPVFAELKTSWINAERKGSPTISRSQGIHGSMSPCRWPVPQEKAVIVTVSRRRPHPHLHSAANLTVVTEGSVDMELWTSYLIPLDFSLFKHPAQEWRVGGLVQVGGQNASHLPRAKWAAWGWKMLWHSLWGKEKGGEGCRR